MTARVSCGHRDDEWMTAFNEQAKEIVQLTAQVEHKQAMWDEESARLHEMWTLVNEKDEEIARLLTEIDTMKYDSGVACDAHVQASVAAERERLATGLDERAAEYERKRLAQVFGGVESSEGTWYRALQVAVMREAAALRAPTPATSA